MLSNDLLQEVKPRLFSGRYNLLLGSGASADAFDSRGKQLLSAWDLTVGLCKLKGVPETTSLARVSQLLEAEEQYKFITVPYHGCKHGESAGRLTSFVWRTAFTFNVDDVVESAYERSKHPKQSLTPINYDASFQQSSNKSELKLIHLHGFTREPEKGYVFSTTEYARVTRGLNSWMHVLSELIASEPFIIAGTSLNEPDLDYYLSNRNETALANNRGPSFFVEPYPNKLTENLCKRHGLILVKAKLAEFLQFLTDSLGSPPSVTELTVPSLKKLFYKDPSPEHHLQFFSNFELVKPAAPNAEGEKSPFYYGMAARWSDLESSLDVPTEADREMSAKVRNSLADHGPLLKIFCLNDVTGSGKSTQLRRVAYDLVKEGHIVFSLLTNQAINIEATAHVMSQLARPVVVVVDNIATHAASLQQIFSAFKPRSQLVIICADRDYRAQHIERLLGHFDIQWFTTSYWKSVNYEQLIERLRKKGLLGSNPAVHQPAKFAGELDGDPVAIGICRALNNFKPLETILRSIWKDANSDAKRSFAIAALAEFCYEGGVRYSILAAAHRNNSLANQIDLESPLPLCYLEGEEFVVPFNAVIGDKLLGMLSRDKPEWLLEMFCNLANALSPHVNRVTVVGRTPEARLAARLFNAEQVARHLLGPHAAQFYIATHDAWTWNSRYWEQRALYTQWEDLETAVQYARHAVALEAHPFPWTTLASLLTKKMERVAAQASPIYSEVLILLADVFKYEKERGWRVNPHPYVVLLNATESLIASGKEALPKQVALVREKALFCKNTFSRDAGLVKLADRVLNSLARGK